MRWTLVAAVLLFPCCGAPNAINATPEAISPVRVSSSQNHAAVCRCSQKRVANIVPQSNSRPIPAGFWCLEYPASPTSPLNVCYSTERTCTTLLKRAHDGGLEATGCQIRATAYCFTMTDLRQQKASWHCYPSTWQCEALLLEVKMSRTQMRYGNCSVTDFPVSQFHQNHSREAENVSLLARL